MVQFAVKTVWSMSECLETKRCIKVLDKHSSFPFLQGVRMLMSPDRCRPHDTHWDRFLTVSASNLLDSILRPSVKQCCRKWKQFLIKHKFIEIYDWTKENISDGQIRNQITVWSHKSFDKKMPNHDSYHRKWNQIQITWTQITMSTKWQQFQTL